MLFGLKRFFPPPVRRALRGAQAQLARGLWQLRPAAIHPPESVRRAVAEHTGATPPDLTISRDDLMYRFIALAARASGEPAERAMVEYLTSGHQMLGVLTAAVHRHFGGWRSVNSFLDFAGGHGRLTRWLVRKIAPERIWVSDIKSDAVEFQRRTFGINGFVSTTDPDELPAPQAFDVVFVGSLFSHLPERTFGPWLRRLANLLSARGLLIFTTHPTDHLKSPAGDFVYRAQSEEAHFSGMVRPLNAAEYGTAYVSERYVAAALRAASVAPGRYARYPRVMWGTQDAYLVSRDGGADLSGLDLLLPQD